MELEDTPTQTGLPGPTRASEFTRLPLANEMSITREQEIEKTKQLYPDLGQIVPTAPPNIYQEPHPVGREPAEPNINYRTNNRSNERSERSEHANNFRLHKINDVQKILETERDKRANLAKKYQRCINVISGFSYGFDIGAVGLGAAGIALLTTL